MCTIGWKKTPQGWILFKNRDRLPRETRAVTNEIEEANGVVLLRDQLFGGCWFGTNGSISLSDGSGPCQKAQLGRTPENELFKLNGEVLEEERTIEGAISRFKRRFAELRIGESYNIILCDDGRAVAMEMCEEDVDVQPIEDSVCRTNHFLCLREHNTSRKDTVKSFRRLENTNALFEKVHDVESMKEVLRHHEEDSSLGICRHHTTEEIGVTIASAILASEDGKLTLYSILNEFPCRSEFEKKELKTGTD